MGNLQRSPRPLAVFKGPTSKRRDGEEANGGRKEEKGVRGRGGRKEGDGREGPVKSEA